jgi:hypothetical protein
MTSLLVVTTALARTVAPTSAVAPCRYCGVMRGPIGVERAGDGNQSQPPPGFNEHIRCYKRHHGGRRYAWHRQGSPAATNTLMGRAMSADAPCQYCRMWRGPIGLERLHGGNRSQPPQGFNEHIRCYKLNHGGKRPPWH